PHGRAHRLGGNRVGEVEDGVGGGQDFADRDVDGDMGTGRVPSKNTRCAPRRALAGDLVPRQCRHKGRPGKSDAMMSAMIGRVSMCAAYGKVAARAARKEGETDEKTAMAAQALSASACAVWCLVENDDTQVVDAVGEGKAAAMVVGASEKTAGVFKEVTQAVLEAEIDWEQPLGEVAHNVAPALQSLALHRVYPGVDHEVEADMEYDIEHRGRKGQRGKQGKDSTGKKGKKGKKGKDSTAA
ncbi:unnamed protein product, partial [Closterium sp. NIES-54]